MASEVNVNWIAKQLAKFSELKSASKKQRAQGHHAVGVRFDEKKRMVIVALANGTFFAFPVDLAQGLSRADSKALSRIEITPLGTGLHWPLLNADLSVEGLLAGFLGSDAWMRAHAARAGRVTSPEKARAARANGAKGGRPRKLPQQAA